MYELRRSYIGVFAAVLLAAVAIAAGVSLFVFDAAAKARQTEQAESLVRVLARQADEALADADLIASGLSAQLGLNNLVDQESLRIAASSRQVFEVLQARTPSLKQIDVITITDLDGQVLNFSRSFPAPNINLRDRDYFQAHLADPALESYLSEPVQNRGNGQWTFYLARKVRAADGSMIGIFLIGLKADYFIEQVTVSGVADHYIYRLLRGGGVVLAQSEARGATDRPARFFAGRSYPFVAELTPKRPAFETAELAWPASAFALLIILTGSGAYLVHRREDVLLTRTRRIQRESEGLKERTAALRLELSAAKARVGELDLIARQAGRIDQLTGLPDRNYAQQFCAFFAETQNQSLSAVVFDIRGLSRLNAASGFEAGNEALRRVGRFLRTECRPADFVGRVGGDEFIILMPEADDAGMRSLMERLRTQFMSGRDVRGVALSVVGVSASSHAERVQLPDAALARLSAGREGAADLQLWTAEGA